MSAATTDALAAGRLALERAAWAEAHAHFATASAADTPEAWDGLSRAAWWLGDEAGTIAARERAYRGYRARGDDRAAARMAMWLASDHLDFRGDDALAAAWIRRGRALVTGACPELGFLVVLEADMALLAHFDPVTGERLAREALHLARSIADTGVEVVALAVLGCALVASGSIAEGLGFLDESAALAVGEDFAETVAPGWALCHTVSACADVGDFARAEQWCRALHTWSSAWHGRHFFGACRTAYGEVLATGGDWRSAEQELLDAMADLSTTRPALAGPTAVRLGRLRVRQGDLTEARALFETALPLPQAIVALGELDLAAGDPTAAADAADRVLRRLDEAGVLDRLPALELLARALAAAGDHEGAAAAAGRLEQQIEPLATPYMRGRGRLVRAQVLVAGGEHDPARRAAEDALDLFTACSAPFEAAQARLVLAEALGALGRAGQAAAAAKAARDALALLGSRAGRASGDLSPRETDILRLVAQGLNDAAIARRLFLSAHTVHRHIANIRTKLGVPSRAAAVAAATRDGLL
ncbi:helix-turn-helix transcriptional regulator [Amycolatopsis sp. ATCC 39116]|uniref:helix-turn-helix domain-containing protein n=1 Tax=Amycolatopsis sp. (strain ATCC 39116 / 75iv2) TaxID=385957 RepID=UPI0002628900|nr:helix-turn-helix transcriptional regulator [Amycolatopsis sp. ATCC 39116]